MTELDQAEHVDGRAPGDPAGQLPTGATAGDERGAGDVRDPFDEGAEDALLADSLGAPTLEAACEAVLLLADEPMDMLTLATIVRRPVDQVEAVVRGLSAQYTEDGRGFDLREVGGGWRFYTRGDCAEVVSRYVVDGQQARLTQAALETLAIVAYRQPISRGRISAVRGVNVDGVVRTLITRGLVVEAGVEPGGHATMLRTTPYLLERLGIASISELPPLADHVPTYAEIGDLVDLP
ncbi:MAG TPA: SMC-Scp complex subunit ScpB [Motilibacterales bacterium]|nr:SMC-Scp complex subunit ScpB [Motilibacterales bacterium]